MLLRYIFIQKTRNTSVKNQNIIKLMALIFYTIKNNYKMKKVTKSKDKNYFCRDLVIKV